MKKVVYIPLDERPCNLSFPGMMFKDSDINLVTIPKSLLGNNKIAAKYEDVKEFLLKETKDSYGLVLSIDTLVYGGIVPSRLHHEDLEVIKKRLNFIRILKENNPKLIIYAFGLIMRCPQYSLSVEEPDYFDVCGKEIFLSGYYKHKQELGIINEKEINNYNSLKIKEEYLEDFIGRRKKNLTINIESLKLVKEKVIDFFILPQDDSAEYGYTALDQEVARKVIRDEKIQLSAFMYPGADEVGCTLVARMYNTIKKVTPKVYVRYPAPNVATIIPTLEDRYFETSLKYQICAAGGIMVPSIGDCDIVLAVMLGADKMIPNPSQIKPREIGVLANYVEMIEFIKAYINIKPIMIADITYLNGGNLELLDLMEEAKITMKLAGYAGWNTSANTLGTVIAQGFLYLDKGQTEDHKLFLVERLVEDFGYCGKVREEVTLKEVQELGLSYFDISRCKKEVEKVVKDNLQRFIDENIPSIREEYLVAKSEMPWNRMFEVDLTIVKK